MALTWLWFGLFVALSALDLHYTRQILNLGGQEANPLMAFMHARFGSAGIAFVKIAVAALVAALLLNGALPDWLLVAITLLYGAANIHLVRERAKLRRRAHNAP